MRYFAYGSNMDPQQMKRRGIKFTKREWATLKGWRIEFNKIASRDPDREGYTNILKDNKGVVEGILYEVSEEDIHKLDKYEGYPNHYNKISINVMLKSGEEVETITYIAQPDKVKEGLKPSKEYLSHLLKGYDLLSEEYCGKLRKWKTLD